MFYKEKIILKKIGYKLLCFVLVYFKLKIMYEKSYLLKLLRIYL